MSYEGYEILICKNNHMHEYDAYELVNLDTWKCPFCNESLLCSQSVDQTNLKPYHFNFKIVQFKNPIFKYCETCHNKTLVEHPKFKFVNTKPYLANQPIVEKIIETNQLNLFEDQLNIKI